MAELAIGILAVALIVQQILHARERGDLLNRIQAPEQVVWKNAPEPSAELLYVPMEDDEAFEDYAQRVDAGEVR